MVALHVITASEQCPPVNAATSASSSSLVWQVEDAQGVRQTPEAMAFTILSHLQVGCATCSDPGRSWQMQIMRQTVTVGVRTASSMGGS